MTAGLQHGEPGEELPLVGRAAALEELLEVLRTVRKGHVRTVVTGGRSAEMESFHPFDSKMDASRPAPDS